MEEEGTGEEAEEGDGEGEEDKVFVLLDGYGDELKEAEENDRWPRVQARVGLCDLARLGSACLIGWTMLAERMVQQSVGM